MRGKQLTVGAIAAAAVLASCGFDPAVTAERSDQIVSGAPVTPTTPPADPTTTDPATPDPSTPDPDTTEPTTSEPSDPDTTSPAPSIAPSEIDPAAINFGSNKTPHDYDEFLLAVMTDLDQWWNAEYPGLYGAAFESLSGGTFAAYPGRPDDLPGCGEPRTTYEDVQQYVAFYCGEGDFIIYDDGDDGLLAQLAAQYGPGTIGIVLAHEFGHAIQTRAGALDLALATIYTEQQADCFAGAWAARVSSGESSIVSFSDADVRSGLIAMTQVSDPVGVDQFIAGGHGSAFDRVGAFQVGFSEGLARCTELLDSPLPLSPNEFVSFEDQQSGGDAVLGYEDGQLLDFIPTDLNLYWNVDVADTAGSIGDIAFVGASSNDVECGSDDDTFDEALSGGAAYCAATATVYLNEPVAEENYNTLGDFSVGYLIGFAWSEAVQQALDTGLDGEQRALLNDCLTGAWVKTTIRGDDGTLPLPRDPAREVSVSAGDLDEAIQTIIGLSDETSTDDVNGGLFEKIDAFRDGVVNGLDYCLADL